MTRRIFAGSDARVMGVLLVGDWVLIAIVAYFVNQSCTRTGYLNDTELLRLETNCAPLNWEQRHDFVTKIAQIITLRVSRGVSIVTSSTLQRPVPVGLP